jgi:hypothetical protein
VTSGSLAAAAPSKIALEPDKRGEFALPADPPPLAQGLAASI